MKKKLLLILIIIVCKQNLHAQFFDAYKHAGEIGISAGVSHYFGDLNPDINISKPKLSAALHYTKQFNNYIGLKLSANYAFLAYADKYSDNVFQKYRNLSFNTDVWEVSVNGTFNFFRFQPGFEGYNFTPYVGLGVGVFSFDPYAYLQNVKYNLQPIGTEGQGSPLYPNRTPYETYAFCIPITLGYKYAITPSFNIFTELRYRFTNTDYLDDVSTTYAPDAFVPGSSGSLLNDRSYDVGFTIGQKGRQRGNSLAPDAFATFHVGISFNIESYKCPNNSYR